MTKKLAVALAATLAVSSLILTTGGARAEDPDLVSFGVGYFDAIHKDDPGAEFRVEYRSGYKLLWEIKPFVALSGVTSGHGFVGAGLLADINIGENFVVTPSIAPHIYFGGDSDLDLSHTIEFRSQLELAYKFEDESRIGAAFSHYSNCGLDDDNPGVETATVYYTVPVAQLLHLAD